MKRIKAISTFSEKRFNDTFKREEKVVTIQVQHEDGVYFQTLRMPLNFKTTDEQFKNLTEFIFNQ
jgi:hypothetical protein